VLLALLDMVALSRSLHRGGRSVRLCGYFHDNGSLNDFLTSLHRAARDLLRAPGLLLFAAVTLGIGIAGPTTMYSIAYGVLRDLPVPDGHELVHIAAANPAAGQHRLNLRPHDLIALRERVRTVADVAALGTRSHDVAAPGERPERRAGAVITPDAFRVLRVAPALGRDLTDDDARPGAPPVVIISDDLWHTRFAADPGVLGSVLRVDGTPTTIVGVMPPRFRFPDAQQLWTPLRLDATALPARGGWQYIAFGRATAGGSLDALRTELATLARQFEREYADANEGVTFFVRPFREQLIDRNLRRILGVMVALVSCMLLIAAANVANLLVIRGAARSRAVAIRAALGASRGRILRENLLEAAVIAVAGGVLGLVLSRIGIALFARALADQLPYWAEFRLALPVLLFAGTCIIVAAFAAGIVPALQASGVNVHDTLRDESRGASSFRLGRATHALVVAQIALSGALLIVAGLMIKGVLVMTRTDGYQPAQTVVARYELRTPRYETDALVAFHRDVVERLGGLAGVHAAAATSHLPGVWTAIRSIEIEGVDYPTAGERPVTHAAIVSPGFFDAVGAPPVLRGRDLDWSDDEGRPHVALVNQAFARRFFAGEDPVGRRVRVHRGGDETGPWITVVGLVANVGIRTGAGENEDALYFPLGQHPSRGMSVVLHTDGDPLTLLAPVRATFEGLDADLPLLDVGRLDRVIRDASTIERVFGTLFGAFGIAALLLAAVGLYGTVAFGVSRRTREFGIRAALGARPAHVVWLAMRGGSAQIGTGALAGCVLALIVAPQMGDALFGISPRDVTVYAVVTLALGATAFAAALVPALRAARIDPTVAFSPWRLGSSSGAADTSRSHSDPTRQR
jgi:putative ABC transport system permease protein